MDFKPFKAKCSTVTDEITSEFESESESKVQTDEVTEKLETTNSIYKNIIHKSTNYNYSPIITDILNFQTETLMLNIPDSTTQYKSNNCTLDDLIKNKCSNDIINDHRYYQDEEGKKRHYMFVDDRETLKKIHNIK